MLVEKSMGTFPLHTVTIERKATRSYRIATIHYLPITTKGVWTATGSSVAYVIKCTFSHCTLCISSAALTETTLETLFLSLFVAIVFYLNKCCCTKLEDVDKLS